MMSQIQLGGVLDQISDFVFGKCNNCDAGGSDYGFLTFDEVIGHYIKPLNIPAYSGTMFGHTDDNSTFPNGLKVLLNADNRTLKMLRPAVI